MPKPAAMPHERYSRIVYGNPASPVHFSTKFATPDAASAARKLAIAPQRLQRFHRIAKNHVMPISGTVCHKSLCRISPS